MPKGVLWRQHDIFLSVMGGAVAGTPHESLESVVEAAKGGSMRVMPAAPFMHGAGHWIALLAMNGGNTVVIQDEVRRLDPKDVLSIVEREKISFLQIVGDAFGRPILDEIEAGSYDLSSLFIILSGGAALNSTLKERFLAAVPHAMILDGMGSSEGGGQMTQVTTAGSDVTTGTFTPGPGTCIVSEDLTRILEPGAEEVGWVAMRGYVPLGYLGDPEKSARTFPVIDGVRYSVPGDRGRQRTDGTVEMLGRDSVTINSGGEKIFAEEVEAALGHHPDVYDAVVCGRPSEQWGQEVVAIVQLRDDVTASRRRRAVAARRVRQAHRSLQVPEGIHLRRHGRALPRRQGRLPLGQRHRGEDLTNLGSMRRRERLLAVALDRVADDRLDVVRIDAELLTDVDRPDLAAQVVLEVEIGADVGPRGLAVLAHHHERGQEDRLEADDHREQSVGELVEDEARAEDAGIDGDPHAEPDRVDVHEVQRSGEGGDAVGDVVLRPFEGPDDSIFVADLESFNAIQTAVLDSVRPVDDTTRLTLEGQRAVLLGSPCPYVATLVYVTRARAADHSGRIRSGARSGSPSRSAPARKPSSIARPIQIMARSFSPVRAVAQPISNAVWARLARPSA